MSEVLDSAPEADERPQLRSRGPSEARRVLAAAMLPGVLLSALLTSWHYSSKPLWRDEFYTLSTARRPLIDMIDLLRVSDGGLTGFYGVMHVWLLIDDSVAWLRLPAAVCTVALPALVTLVTMRIAGTGAAAAAGVLVAVMPAVTSHAQEARAYPLVLLACTATALVALRQREHRQRDGPGRSRPSPRSQGFCTPSSGCPPSSACSSRCSSHTGTLPGEPWRSQ